MYPEPTFTRADVKCIFRPSAAVRVYFEVFPETGAAVTPVAATLAGSLTAAIKSVTRASGDAASESAPILVPLIT